MEQDAPLIPPPHPSQDGPPSGYQLAFENEIRKSRNWLLAVAVLQSLGCVVYFLIQASSGVEPLVLIASAVVMGVLALVFWGLWFWSKRALFPATLTALILYVTFNLLDAIVDPATLARGILMKVFIFGGLCVAVSTSNRLRKKIGK